MFSQIWCEPSLYFPEAIFQLHPQYSTEKQSKTYYVGHTNENPPKENEESNNIIEDFFS